MLRTERLRSRAGGRDVLKVVGEMFLAGRASVACGAGKGAGTSNANMGCMPHGLMLMPLGGGREKGRTAAGQGGRDHEVEVATGSCEAFKLSRADDRVMEACWTRGGVFVSAGIYFSERGRERVSSESSRFSSLDGHAGQLHMSVGRIAMEEDGAVGQKKTSLVGIELRYAGREGPKTGTLCSDPGERPFLVQTREMRRAVGTG